MRIQVALTALFTLLLLMPFASREGNDHHFEYKLKTIVIDAGHGGHDTGCQGSSSYEKNVTLAIALKLGAMIEKNLPDVKVIYTRKTDEFIELRERADIANRNRADLFISIHCNANPNTAAFGTESWTMGLHKSEGNLEVAKRENSSILLEDNYVANYDGFNPNSPEAYIMFSLNQNAFIDQSLQLAAKVEEEFKQDNRNSRGVKQAGFLVLWRTTMPSTLIETGFLTNPREEKYMTSENGQNEIAGSIFDAVKSYKEKMEKSVNSLYKKEENPANEQKEEAAPKEEVKSGVQVKAVPTTENSSTTSQAVPADDNVISYKVQVAASRNHINIHQQPFNKLKDISVEKDGNQVEHVLVGSYAALDDAKQRLQQLKKQGFTDAFLVEYKGGQKFAVR